MNRRDTEDRAVRAVDLKCADIPQQRRSSALDDEGRSIYQRTLCDLRELPNKRMRLSSNYWTARRREFGFEQVAVAIEVKDPAETVGKDIQNAVRALLDRNPASRSAQPLSSILNHRAALCQRELVLVVRSLTTTMTVQGFVSKQITSQLWIELVKMIVRFLPIQH